MGEQYYSPLTDYISVSGSERGSRPGALSYSERLHYKWLTGRRSEGQQSGNR